MHSSLPFALKAPTHTSLSYLEGGDSPTSMIFSYSQDSEMSTFLSQMADPETYDQAMAKIKACGYDELWVDVQVDWAIDDKENGWHYTPYWDTLGYAIDEETGNSVGTTRVGVWDIADLGIDGNTTHNLWILRGPFAGPDFTQQTIDDVDNFDYYVWNGSGEEDPNGYMLGLKSQLQDGQYTIETNLDGSK